MSLKAKVRGFRGIEKADIEIEPIALLAGRNFAGKTSICQAVAAAATGQAIPFFRSSRPDKPLLTKTEAKGLLRGGMEQGFCQIINDKEPIAKVTWPGLAVSGNGSIQTSMVAAGLINPMKMEEIDRQRFFSTLLSADPTLDDLTDALRESIAALADPTNVETLNKIRSMVEVNGWDVAHKHFKENGARRKGEWEGKAGEAYGSKKAEGWRPEGWREELADLSLEDIGSACSRAQEDVEAAVAALAVDTAVLAQLREQAEGEADAWNCMEDAEGLLKLAVAEEVKATEHWRSIPVPSALPCPHCGGSIDMVERGGGKMELVQSLASAEQIREAKSAKEVAHIEMIKAKEKTVTYKQVRDGATARYQAVKGSSERLKEMQGRAGTQEAVDQARDRLRSLMADKDMIERVEACDVLSKQVDGNQRVIDILAPDGLRRQKLQRALAAFNGRLRGLCGDAEFPAVAVDDNLEVLYGGRRYFLLSGSEQYRVKAVMQIAVAMEDKSPLVIFDGADILDQDGRNGLFAMMGETEGLRYVVGMTVLAKRNVPDLAKAGLGASYWVEEGIAAPL